MLEQKTDITARLRATIEEELGSFRQFAHVPSAEIEEMAGRLVRAIEPLLGAGDKVPETRAA
jgi:hypothetical protein